MAAKTVGFAISDEARPERGALVEHFANGNRSEFLRVAMWRLGRDMRAERLQQLQAGFRGDLGCRVVSPEEVKPNAVQLSHIAATHRLEIRGNGGCPKIENHSN